MKFLYMLQHNSIETHAYWLTPLMEDMYVCKLQAPLLDLMQQSKHSFVVCELDALTTELVEVVLFFKPAQNAAHLLLSSGGN